MTAIEMFGQSGFLAVLGLGILLLIILIIRVSIVEKRLNALEEKLSIVEAKAIVNVPVSGLSSVNAGSAAIPNAVIAAISAAVNEYRKNNI